MIPFFPITLLTYEKEKGLPANGIEDDHVELEMTQPAVNEFRRNFNNAVTVDNFNHRLKIMAPTSR